MVRGVGKNTSSEGTEYMLAQLLELIVCQRWRAEEVLCAYLVRHRRHTDPEIRRARMYTFRYPSANPIIRPSLLSHNNTAVVSPSGAAVRLRSVSPNFSNLMVQVRPLGRTLDWSMLNGSKWSRSHSGPVRTIEPANLATICQHFIPLLHYLVTNF
jgi:hypothetical protein